MGTVTFSIEKLGQVNRNVRGRFVLSGSHTSNNSSASNLTDGAAGSGSEIAANKGDILTIRCNEDLRVKMGGETATSSEGSIVFANHPTNLEITGSGTISVIDAA